MKNEKLKMKNEKRDQVAQTLGLFFLILTLNKRGLLLLSGR